MTLRPTEVMPSTIRNTHTVASAPHVSSFEALLLSYGDRLSDVAPTSKDLFKGFVADAGQGINSALEGAADWLAQHTGAQLGNKKTLDVTDIADEVRTRNSGRHSRGPNICTDPCLLTGDHCFLPADFGALLHRAAYTRGVL